MLGHHCIGRQAPGLQLGLCRLCLPTTTTSCTTRGVRAPRLHLHAPSIPPSHPLGLGVCTLVTGSRGGNTCVCGLRLIRQGVPGSLGAQTVKNPLAVQETRVRRIHWSRKWLLTLVFLPGEFHGQRSLAGYSPQELRVGHDWVASTFTLCQSPGCMKHGLGAGTWLAGHCGEGLPGAGAELGPPERRIQPVPVSTRICESGAWGVGSCWCESESCWELTRNNQVIRSSQDFKRFQFIFPSGP